MKTGEFVTMRGKEATVIIAPHEYRQLLPKPAKHVPLVRFFQGLGLDGLDLERESNTGRDTSF